MSSKLKPNELSIDTCLMTRSFPACTVRPVGIGSKARVHSILGAGEPKISHEIVVSHVSYPVRYVDGSVTNLGITAVKNGYTDQLQ